MIIAQDPVADSGLSPSRLTLELALWAVCQVWGGDCWLVGGVTGPVRIPTGTELVVTLPGGHSVWRQSS